MSEQEEARDGAHARDLDTLWGMLAGCAGWHPDPQATWARFRRIATEQGVPMASEVVEAEARERIAKRPPVVTDEDVEAGARALYEGWDEGSTLGRVPWEKLSESSRSYERVKTRAVLEAVEARRNNDATRSRS